MNRLTNQKSFLKPRAKTTNIVPRKPITSKNEINHSKRDELLAKTKIKNENLKNLNITGCVTCLYSYEEQKRICAGVLITKTKTETDPEFNQGTVNDPRMGGINTSSNATLAQCQQCGRPNCPGHYGLIDLHPRSGWIHNPIFVKWVMMILQCVCNDCSRLLVPYSVLEKKGILNLEQNVRLKEIYDICVDITVCKQKGEKHIYEKENGQTVEIKKQCGICPIFESKGIVDEGVIKFYKRNIEGKKEGVLKAYTVEKVFNILNFITERDAEILGMPTLIQQKDGEKMKVQLSHPRDAIVRGILVIPELSRPPVYEGTNELKQDKLTKQYNIIVARNEAIKKDPKFSNISWTEYDYKEKEERVSKEDKKSMKKTQKTEMEEINKRVYDLYTSYYHLLYNPGEGKNPKTKKNGGKDYKSVIDRLQGKEAIMRSQLMGKKNDYCARTVASPDPTCLFGQCSIPSVWKKIATKRVRVTQLNYNYILSLRTSGQIDYAVSYATGVRFGLHFSHSYKLKIGDLVERYGLDGDRHIVNRQPSLHKYSIMSYEVKYSNRLTIGQHLSHTSPMNCDFDGDENNVWCPQNIEVETECLYILDVRKNIISTQSNKPLMGLVMNSVTGSYLLTDDKVILPRSLFIDCMSEIRNDEYFDTFSERLRKYGVHPLSGKALFSLLLPEDFNYMNGQGVNMVLIIEGILVFGQLKKKHVGNSDRSIIQELWKKYGHKRVTKFLSDGPVLINHYLKETGFTVGMRDVDDSLKKDPDTGSIYYKGVVEGNEEITIPKEKLIEMYAKIDALELNKKESKYIKDLKEVMVANIVNIGDDAGNKLADKILQGNNAIATMTERGAQTKGASQNIMQILGSVGQQYYQGKRFEQTITDGTRCLPAFDKNDTDPEARGFVKESFSKGLTPEGLFNIQKGARENLIDTALKTSVTGNIEHLLIRSMENMRTYDDGSVRNTVGALFSPLYNCGYNPSEMLSIKNNPEMPELSSFVDVDYLTMDLNFQSGWFPEDIYKIIMEKRQNLQKELKINPIKKPIKFISKKKKPEKLNHIETGREYGDKPQKLSVYESSRIIWTRALQLSMNAEPLIDVGSLIDPLKISRKEFKRGILKIYALRKLPNGEVYKVYPTKDNINYSIL